MTRDICAEDLHDIHTCGSYWSHNPAIKSMSSISVVIVDLHLCPGCGYAAAHEWLISLKDLEVMNTISQVVP